MKNSTLKAILLILSVLFLALDIVVSQSSSIPSYQELLSISKNSVENTDSSTQIVEQYYQAAIANNDSAKCIETLMALSDICRINESYSKAFDYSGEALFLAEQIQDSFLRSEAYKSLGTLHYLFYQKDEAIQYLESAIRLSPNDAPNALNSKYFSLALAHRQFENYDKALLYLDTCQMLITETENTLYLNSERGIVFLKQTKHKEAIKFLKLAAKQFEAIDPTADSNNVKGYLLVIHSYLAEAYLGIEDYNRARTYYKLAYNALEDNKRYISHKAGILEKYGELQYLTQEYKAAYDKLKQAYQLNEKHYSAKSISNNDFITTRNTYKNIISEKDRELLSKNLQLAEQKQLMLRVRIFLFSGVLILIALSIFLQSRRRISQQKNRIIAAENKEREAQALIELRNKELTASTLQLIEKDETISQLSDHIKSIDLSKASDAVLKSLNQSNTQLWEDFNSRFIAVNKGFYERLIAQCPKLSPAELKLCALIKLNFSGKEMAHLLGISVDSVHKARYRLRKKLNIEREVNLVQHINQI